MSPVEIPESERRLLVWWKFDETEGDSISDSSGNNYGGTLIGGPKWQPEGGKVGGALAFDGVDDYVDCGSHKDLNLADAVSVSAWIKLAGPAQDQKIIGNQDDLTGGYKLGIYAGKAEFEVRDSGNMLGINRFVGGGTILQPGVWHHVAGTYSRGGFIRTYVNGKLDKELATPSMLAPSTGTLKIGREPFAELYWFNGLMDDLKIYNYPLSEAEVAAVYSGQALPMVAEVKTSALNSTGPGKPGR